MTFRISHLKIGSISFSSSVSDGQAEKLKLVSFYNSSNERLSECGKGSMITDLIKHLPGTTKSQIYLSIFWSVLRNFSSSCPPPFLNLSLKTFHKCCLYFKVVIIHYQVIVVRIDIMDVKEQG